MTGQQLTTFVFYTQFVTSASFDVGDQVTSSSNTSFILFYFIYVPLAPYSKPSMGARAHQTWRTRRSRRRTYMSIV